jgi:transcriptional regulator with PAS, ATPase and Fis domain
MPGPRDDPPIETELEPADEAAGAPLDIAYLVCRRDERLEVVALAQGEEAVVGRTEGTILVDSPRVSRRHARFTLQGGRLEVEDLGSRNGTRVGSTVLRGEKRTAGAGDVVKVGPLLVVVATADRALGWSAPAAPTAAQDADDDATGGEAVVVADPAMVALHKVIERVAPTAATVLVVGETGTGKEVIAERIHRRSPRAKKPFVRLNCASLPETLLESELFGHEKGAFTGADRRRAGHFEAASGGTLLLDEIGEMPPALQAKLLRVLESRAVVRVGSSVETPVDTRILCATHRVLEQEVAAGRFRQDLFYRIATFTLEVPPLRARPTEVLLLADAFLRRFAAAAGRPAPALSDEAARVLLAYAWPGNVRELRNAMEHAVVMTDAGVVSPEHLPRTLHGPGAPASAPMRDTIEDVERQAIVAALAAEGNNRTRAAKRLGISRRALIYKIIKHGLRD